MSKKEKAVYVVYGATAALMKAVKKALPDTVKQIHQNSKYFDPSSLVDGANKLIIVDDCNAEKIEKAYEESKNHPDGMLVEIDIENPPEPEVSNDDSDNDTTVTIPNSGREVTEVNGLGEATAKVLAEAGIDTLDKLAAIEEDAVESLAESTGVAQLATFVASAKELLNVA